MNSSIVIYAAEGGCVTPANKFKMDVCIEGVDRSSSNNLMNPRNTNKNTMNEIQRKAMM